jgi:hypothetical protein
MDPTQTDTPGSFSPACPSRDRPFVTKAEPAKEPATTKEDE